MIHSPIHFSHKLPSIQLSNPKKQCEIFFLQKNPSIEKKEKFPVIGNNRYNNTKLLLLKKSTDSNRSSQTNDCSSLLRQNSSGSGTKSKNWKKVSNIIRSISLLRQHETREIKNEKEFENDLKDYEVRLFPNTTRTSKESKRKKSKETFHKKMTKLFIEAITDDIINNNEHNREVIKEELYYQIQTNQKNIFETIDEFFKYNPDRNLRKVEEPDFIFNTPLKSNKKTILYLACQEGKDEIVSYLLDKKLNPKINSVVDDIEESPLECACRWNFVKVVDVLLKKVEYNKSEILCALRINGMSRSVIALLKKSLRLINEKQEKATCFC